MLPSSQQINNPLRPTSPSEATSLSNNAPGTKSWTRSRGPSQRPLNYLSRGPLKPRPKLFHGGETNYFHRMYDEAGGTIYIFLIRFYICILMNKLLLFIIISFLCLLF